ncbi:MAG: 2-succinyl-5-enolpyruvyl-6-hydroxy-3-cyclohexene-1-carboxylic-acid synthase [Acidobacteriota bacterium]
MPLPPEVATSSRPSSASAPSREVLTAWSRLLLQSLADAGVRDVVISPGSRSTPFLAAARATPALRCVSILDERSAAFYALGQGRSSGRPSLLLCTSGSAAANYLPAVVEASASGVPLIALTADRPFELQRCSAPQTIDQVRLFGDHARAYLELGAPDPHPAALRGLRRLAAQAVALSRGPEPGAVHLNARARKPLEPSIPEGAEGNLWAQVEELLREPLPPTEPAELQPAPRSIQRLVRALRQSRRPVIALGPAPLEDSSLRFAVARLAAAANAVVFAEATSQLRFGPWFDSATDRWPGGDPRKSDQSVVEDPRFGSIDALVAAARGEGLTPKQRVEKDAQGTTDSPWLPDFILQIGPPLTSGAWLRWLDDHRAQRPRRIVLSRRGWPDPHGSAEEILWAEPSTALERVTDGLHAAAEGIQEPGTGGEDLQPQLQHHRRRWVERLQDLQRRCESTIENVVQDRPRAEQSLTEGWITRALVQALPEAAQLTVGNSLPVRHLDAWTPIGGPSLRLLSQRGANGIDGLTSGALGSASIREAEDGESESRLTPAALLYGDVSFLHDLGGLHCARYVQRPVAVVVIHNDGGRIFEQLPIAKSPQISSQDLDYWLTPHGLSLESAAALFQLPYARAENPQQLQQALSLALREPGVHLIEARVAPDSATQELKALKQKVAELLVESDHDSEP